MSKAPADIVQRQLDTYNAQDLEGFLDCFADDCVIGPLNGDATEKSKREIRARYSELFAKNPQNRSRLVHRIVLNNLVFDHEQITRGPGSAPFEMVAVYTIKDGRIARVNFAK